MALEMNFTDACGVPHPRSHWRMVQLNIGAADKNILVTFYAYASFDAFAGGLLPLSGGTKTYFVSGPEFDAVAEGRPAGVDLYDALALAAEAYALAKHDTPSGHTDAAGNPQLVSFFDGANQV